MTANNIDYLDHITCLQLHNLFNIVGFSWKRDEDETDVHNDHYSYYLYVYSIFYLYFTKNINVSYFKPKQSEFVLFIYFYLKYLFFQTLLHSSTSCYSNCLQVNCQLICVSKQFF